MDVVVYMRGSKNALEKFPGPFAALVEIHRVGSCKFLYKHADAPLQLFLYQEMKVIGHDTVCADVNKRFIALKQKYLFGWNVFHGNGLRTVTKIE